jgi:hypothetical protein
MAILAPVITQSASYANSGKLFISCPGASNIYMTTTLAGVRPYGSVASGDSTLTGLPLPVAGVGIYTYGADGMGNVGPTAYYETY